MYHLMIKKGSDVQVGRCLGLGLGDNGCKRGRPAWRVVLAP
jgi:hypothetical protein